MSLQDYLAILTFAFAIAGVVFALGKQAQRLGDVEVGLNGLGTKVDHGFDKFEAMVSRLDRRLDKTNEFRVRVDQRVAELQRHVYGDDITEFLRSGTNFHPNNDDTEPMT